MTLPMHIFEKIDIYDGDVIESREMPVSAEYILTVLLEKKEFSTIACSGKDIRELVMGHILSEEIVSSSQEVEDIHFDADKMEANVILKKKEDLSSAFSTLLNVSVAGGKSSRKLPSLEHARKELPLVKAEIICRCMEEFLNHSDEHDLTHGVHGAALYSLKGETIAFFDDIGRHNAIDKIIGYSALGNMELTDCMICTTGRVSSEIILKIINSGARVLVSRASPTSYSIRLARKYNILLVCRARGKGFWIINGKDSVEI